MNPLANPEFMRNAWLELTPQRLLAMPAVLALILLIAYLGESKALHLAPVAMILFVVVTVLYGTKLAGDSMTDELVQGTWDSQRLSGLGAWSMTLGKLFGGPVFAWYGGAFCLIVFVAASPAEYATLRSVLIAVGVAIGAHALALLSQVTAWRKLPPTSIQARRSGSVMVLLALMFVPQLMVFMVSGREMPDVHWYAWTFAGADFALLCTCYAVFWAVLGLYRSLREELAFRDPPVAWIAFLVFVFAFIGGWFHNGEPQASGLPLSSPLTAHLATCAIVSLVATYLLLFGERKDWVKLRRILAHWQGGERKRAFELMPKWMATFVLTAAVAAAFAVIVLVRERGLDGIALTAAALGFFVLLARDGAIVLGLNFTRDQRRADAAAALYLGVLYVLLPALLGVIGLKLLLPVFLPPMLYEQPPWVVLMLLQAAAALDFARRRWRDLPAPN
ncbi:MAG: hypothetical protein ACT4PK_07300 [Gammaproteobacteria bacterium]